MEPIPLKVDKIEAVGRIAERLGLPAPGQPKFNLKSVIAAFGQVPGRTNAGLAFCGSADVPGAAAETYLPEKDRQAPPPDHRNRVPTGFEGVTGGERCPALKVLTVPDGILALVGRAPVVLAATRGVIADFSSGYARLLQAYDWDAPRVLAEARHIPGTALALCDDVWPLNYSHWLLDELPRLAFLGARRDLSVVISAPTAQFQYDTLRHFGFAPEQVVTVEDFHAVRADRLLVTADLREMPHPAFKGADWALKLLRTGLSSSEPSPRRRKLYVSRADAGGRHLRNEDALMTFLEPFGYESVRLSKLCVAAQAALFASASHIVGLHGADLANLAFAEPGTRVVELFSEGYGTPAYYVIAAAMGCRYASYVATGAVADQKDRPQIHDAHLDLDHFAHACRDILWQTAP